MKNTLGLRSKAFFSLVLFAAAAPAFATGVLDLAKGRAVAGSWCTHTGINISCDRALQGLAVGGAAVNTANPGDLQVDSSNVPRAPRQCKQGPAPACSYGYQVAPSYSTSTCSWNYSCIPQSPMPPASVCPNGFASGPTFNASSNSWSYTCRTCVDVAQTPVACSSAAGTYGVPSNATSGNASWTKNSCSGAITYTGGCSVPPAPLPPPSYVCTNGFASGPTFNAGSNSWSYSCNPSSFIFPTPAAQPPMGYAAWTDYQHWGGRSSTFECSHMFRYGSTPFTVTTAGACGINLYKNLSKTASPAVYGAGPYGAYPANPYWLGQAGGPGNHYCWGGISSNGGDLKSIAVRMGCNGSYDGAAPTAALLRMSGTGYVPLPQGWPNGSTGWVDTGARTNPNWGGSVRLISVMANVSCQQYSCQVQLLPVGPSSDGNTNLQTYYITRQPQ